MGVLLRKDIFNRSIDQTLFNNNELADIMDNYFIDITKTLGLQRNLPHISQPLKSYIHVFKHYECIDHLIPEILFDFSALMQITNTLIQ